jgi:hypothetical protein
VVLSGISKGGLGAAGGLMVPIMSLTISPVQAAAIALPILLSMDLVGVYAYRNDWDRRQTAILLPAGILGLALGASRLELATRWVLLIGAALTVLAFVGMWAYFGFGLEYRFEVIAIMFCWLTLVVSGVMLALVFRRSPSFSS